MGTIPVVPTDNTEVGQVTIGFPTETVTDPNTGVTGQFTFNPAHIAWAIADPTVASFTVDPATGQATFTALAVGSTTGTATDSDTGASDTYNLAVTAAAQPNTYALSVTFQPKAS